MTSKRPIDLLRDSGKSIQIDGDGDDSVISEMIPIGDALHMVKAHSIHAVQLADQIDPGRTNIAIPDTHRQILSMGASDPVVARTLLTAHTLFKRTYLGASFNEEQGLKLALELAQDIVAMSEMLASLELAETQARASFETQKLQGGALRLPAIDSLKPRCDAFAQKAGHVIKTLEDIAKLFYGNELTRKWIDSLAALAAERYGKDTPFAQYMGAVRPFLLFVLDMRNMIEHPAPKKFIKVDNFRLLNSGQIAAPSVEIVRSGEQDGTATITLLMKKVIDDLVSASEVLIAHLSSVNAQRFAGLPIYVIELPMERRRNKNQRFYYGSQLGDQVVPIG